MSYIVNLSERAIEDSDRLEQDEPKAYKKFWHFLRNWLSTQELVLGILSH